MSYDPNQENRHTFFTLAKIIKGIETVYIPIPKFDKKYPEAWRTLSKEPFNYTVIPKGIPGVISYIKAAQIYYKQRREKQSSFLGRVSTYFEVPLLIDEDEARFWSRELAARGFTAKQTEKEAIQVLKEIFLEKSPTDLKKIYGREFLESELSKIPIPKRGTKDDATRRKEIDKLILNA